MECMKCIVLRQLTAYLQSHNLFSEMQSTYRKGHSIETVGLQVYSNLVNTIEKGEFTLLSLLNLSATFDTVDCNILLQWLSTSFGVKDWAQMVPVIS